MKKILKILSSITLKKIKEYIKNDEDISNFLKENKFLIYLDVDKNNKLYLDCKSIIEKENT